VPTYEYECDACHRVFEVRQRISEPALTTCDVCGGTVRRLLSAAPFILKGEGWYVTDYPSESRKKAMASEKSSSTATPSADKPAAKADGAKSDGAKSEGTKSEGAKSEGTKSEGAKSDGGSSSSGGTSSGASSSSASTKSD
jgi:putative FmdB family regulatory protein